MGLYWWQLGVEMSLDKLFEPAALQDALRWAAARRASRSPRTATNATGGRRGDQDPRWTEGLLVLAEMTYAAQGPLMSVLAKQLCDAVGGTFNGAATIHERLAATARCLGLTASRDRKALLGAFGLTLTPLEGADFKVQTRQAPSFEALSMPTERGGVAAAAQGGPGG